LVKQSENNDVEGIKKEANAALGGNEENHEISVAIVSVPTEIRTSTLYDTIR
jgi:hypothetical protein